MQYKRLITRAEAKYAFLVLLVLVVLGFIESCLHFYGADVGEIPSASYGWAGNMDSMQIQTMRVLSYFLIFLLAGSVFSDSFFLDAKSKIVHLAVTRSTLNLYLASTGLLTFLGGFVVVFVPLLLSQLLALVAFPAIAAPNSFSGLLNTPAFYDHEALMSANNALFPSLYLNHPYANNMLFICYTSTWAGLMSLASFTVSLFVRKSRLVVLAVPTIAYLVLVFVAPNTLALVYYLYPHTLSAGLSPVFFFAAPLVVGVGLLAAIVSVSTFKKDLLL